MSQYIMIIDIIMISVLANNDSITDNEIVNINRIKYVQVHFNSDFVKLECL